MGGTTTPPATITRDNTPRNQTPMGARNSAPAEVSERAPKKHTAIQQRDLPLPILTSRREVEDKRGDIPLSCSHKNDAAPSTSHTAQTVQDSHTTNNYSTPTPGRLLGQRHDLHKGSNGETATRAGGTVSGSEWHQLPARLAAAKPAVWRARGELVHLPWKSPTTGLILVIDMWSGIGGLLVALLSLGLRCIVISAEQEDSLHAALTTCFLNVVVVQKVEHLQGHLFEEVLRRRNFQAILMGGGSPCQGNSSLNRGRRGMDDARSQMPLEMARLRRELEQHAKSTPIFSFIENVGSAPQM